MLLGTLGGVHIYKQTNNHTVDPKLNKSPETDLQVVANNVDAHANNNDSDFAPQTNANSHYELISELITAKQTLEAVNAINEHYSSLTSDQLSLLKSALLAQAFDANTNDTSKTKNILLATSKAFDDLDVWTFLGDIAALDNDWSTAFNANLRASELENNPTDLETLLRKLVISSSHLSNSLKDSGDHLSIKNLYQRLSDLHPNFTRFKYELAVASIALGETENAKRLLQALIYDLELGEVSKNILAKIQSKLENESTPSDVAVQKQPSNIRNDDIVVPLISAGSSFIVDTTIERKPVRLLLDTGASITSLSTELVSRLNLEPTGQEIRLSTANGITRSRIYKIKQLRMGSLVLRDMLIAEIDLSNNRQFQGLLGTDALNQLKPKYSYLIDNRESALIFRKR